MQKDANKTTNQSDENDHAPDKADADKLEDLPQKPVSDRDAQSVTGGWGKFEPPDPC